MRAFCPKQACRQSTVVAVRDETGSALTDFAATLADANAMQQISVTAGGRSGSASFVPRFETTMQSNGCPGCPVANTEVVVR